MRFYDAFAGVGGFHLGIRQAHPDWECAGACEWDKYCQQVYSKRFEGVKVDGDIRGLDRLPEGTEMLCGGFPCQPFSIAGKRKGLDEERGTLFGELARLAEVSRPRLLFFENVKGLLSAQNGYAFAHIIQRLDELGYFVEWQVLNSKNFGVPQNRERVFIVGHLGGEPARKVFPLGEGDSGVDEDEIGKKMSWAGRDVIFNYTPHTGRPQPIPEAKRVYEVGEANLLPPTKPHPTLIRLDENESVEHRVYGSDGISPTLPTGTTGGNLIPKIMIHGGVWRKGEFGDGTKEECAFTLDRTCGRDLLIPSLSKIRRLTPIECERLQGFPDGWTEGVSDSQRYKMMGNAVSVPVVKEIARRLE